MTLPIVAAAAIAVALSIYSLSGGADFGGGMWDLLASGPRRDAQRRLIERAIGPIWEANHVWLIVAVVLLFTAFPPAFAAYMIALHIPLTAALVGIVLRGAAFVFRSYGSRGDAEQRRWGRVFAIASTGTPAMLGICAGAAASGRAALDGGRPVYGFLGSWLAPFPIALGAFALTLLSLLGAVYLAWEADDDALREDFRRRALAAAVATGVTAFATLLLARADAPVVWRALTTGPLALTFQLATGAAAVGTIVALVTHRIGLARVLAPIQVALVLWGWFLAQYPHLVMPDLTIENAAAPAVTLRLVIIALALGSVLLFPALYYLYRVSGKFGARKPQGS